MVPKMSKALTTKTAKTPSKWNKLQHTVLARLWAHGWMAASAVRMWEGGEGGERDVVAVVIVVEGLGW